MVVARLDELDLGAALSELPGAPAHPDPIAVTAVTTPLGTMVAAAIGEGLCLLEFADRRAFRTELRDLIRLLGRPVAQGAGQAGCGHLEGIAGQLREYFDGRRRGFTVPRVTPGTAFERSVWARLLKIPFGRTCSYGGMAAAIGNPEASRAVGRANGRNRIAIVVPCHRVIESTGGLRGYGGGLERKRALLEEIGREH